MWTCDASDVHAMTKRAEDELGPGLARRMLKAGAQAIKYEVQTHPYHNRTGRLEHTTRAYTVVGADEVDLYMVMEMFYASFVNNLGYSHIDDAALQCGQWIARGFQTMPVRIVTGMGSMAN